MSDQPEWMQPAEVAVLLRIKPGTLANWRSRGKGPPFYKRGGYTVIYKRAEVRTWIEKNYEECGADDDNIDD